MTFLLLLPFFLLPQADPAQGALKKIDETLLQAKSVTLIAKTEIRGGGEVVTIATTAVFKGSRANITGAQTVRGTPQGFVSAVEDNRLRVRFDLYSEEAVDVPKEYLTDLQSVLVRAGVFPLTALTQPKIAKTLLTTPGKIIDVSELKLGDDARSLSYVLQFHGIPALNAYGGGKFKTVLRFDPATGAMTGRTLSAVHESGLQVTITETYELILNAEIPEAQLQMPERIHKRGGYRPTECFSNQCNVEPADAKEGRWVTYAMKTGGSETRTFVRVVGKAGDDRLIEIWYETANMKYGFLFRQGAEGALKKAWAAAEGEASWSPIAIKEAPKPATGDFPKPELQESDEKKQVPAGTFDCRRVESSVTINSHVYKSSSWFSKEVWRLQSANGQTGGLVAMESSGLSTVLEAKGEDAKPAIPLPKE